MTSPRTAIVIGAGFGGLALAIRLQSAGIMTTVVESRDEPGGRAYVWRKEGYVFDAGPTVITDPACLRELWALTASDMSADVDLIPVSPFYRLLWGDGTSFDYSNDDESLNAEIAKLDPADVEGYARFLDYSRGVYEDGYVKLGAVPFLTATSMVKAAPALIRHKAWHSVYATVSRFVRNEKLRQALSFHTLLVGGNPMRTSSIYALIHALEKSGGVWFARGGTNRLVSGMAALFKRLGGTIILDDGVVRILHEGKQVTGVITRSGQRLAADMIASNADIVHSYGLLMPSPVAARRQKRLRAKRFSPSLFVVHFGLRGHYPDIAHHSILFSDRYGPLLRDIYDHRRLAPDPSLYLHHPSATDPSMAPEGHSTFYALAPVPHLGKADIDWATEGPRYRNLILDQVQEMLIPDLRDRLDTVFHYSPVDFRDDLGAHLGSAFSLEPILTQSAWFRAHNRDDHFGNLFFVGAGTHPGAGIPGVVGSAKATAGLMIG
ncbi:phytoene desaturase [Novosphingobium sp. P6W]|uniref:phytoene desaturase n=1 Tax=Novosphingobium sp. P6W TaxID=1609758 RepID=UPI0005C2D80C|nr:phytoene desaturase [Novosphingobium sp. P6W]AXB76544.1 phytoene desaturase [Novosphingobium sp. P6W]KIS30793.1 phytoene dehydrogenase [Novosphingobium sp. P6W]